MPFSCSFCKNPDMHILAFKPLHASGISNQGSQIGKFNSYITKGKIQFMVKYEAKLEPLWGIAGPDEDKGDRYFPQQNNYF